MGGLPQENGMEQIVLSAYGSTFPEFSVSTYGIGKSGNSSITTDHDYPQSSQPRQSWISCFVPSHIDISPGTLNFP